MTPQTKAAIFESMQDNLLAGLAARLDGTRQPIPLLKQAVADTRTRLGTRFAEGEDTGLLISDYTGFMDGIIRLAWHRFTWHENRKSWWKSRISLIAVGGYGRRQLLPHSDIDLLILLERNSQPIHRSNIQSFITLLWDIGLEAAHSVRTIKDCHRQAARDVTVLTAMMESRTLCGDNDLRLKVNRQISIGKIWSPKDYFLAKREEQRARHLKSDHTEYSLEPNVKTSPGGLRDIQTLAWVAKRQYGTESFDALAAQGILTEDERDELLASSDFLLRVRFALHTLHGRDENRLLFENQQQLATQFGYRDGDQLAVEQFMQGYYQVVHRVNTINEILLQHFDEVIIKAAEKLTITPINRRFRLINNYLEVTSESVFQEQPSALLEMFVLIGADDKIQGIRASTIRMARQEVSLIDEAFRTNPENTRLFMALLGSNHYLFTQLHRMARYGILGAYLPEFGRVIGQMQFDLFHIYTVDAHTLQVVRNMRRFRYRNQEQRFPIAANIHRRLPRVELLYIAGLYHDIAKGLGGDHSELGTSIARAFCERHQLPARETDLVCWLVKHHLLMSTTAQRKDTQNPQVIHEFAILVGNQTRLDYLYALTVADINATNPTLWNGWRARLLQDLYLYTRKALRRGPEYQLNRTGYIQDIQQEAISRLTEGGIAAEAVLRLWDHVDDDYFVREKVTDIIWHAEEIMHRDPTRGPLILIQDKTQRGADGFTRIFIHTKDRKDLFVSILTALDTLMLDIVDAGIATSLSDMTFNTFTVLGADRRPVGDDPSMIERIRKTLLNALNSDALSSDALNSEEVHPQARRTSRRLGSFQMMTEISIRQDPHLGQSVLEVIAPDRPGLLAIIARVLVECDINLATAKITTLGERVEDLFYITDRQGKPITDPGQQKWLHDLLQERITAASG